MGVEGGKPAAGTVGAQPEWFYKGDGSHVVGTGNALPSPDFALDGSEEPEIAGIYIIDEHGNPHRLGFCLANEFSDHIIERGNYLWLAHSKLRHAALGPELLTGELPGDVREVASGMLDEGAGRADGPAFHPAADDEAVLERQHGRDPTAEALGPVELGLAVAAITREFVETTVAQVLAALVLRLDGDAGVVRLAPSSGGQIERVVEAMELRGRVWAARRAADDDATRRADGPERPRPGCLPDRLHDDVDALAGRLPHRRHDVGLRVVDAHVGAPFDGPCQLVVVAGRDDRPDAESAADLECRRCDAPADPPSPTDFPAPSTREEPA